MGVIRGLAQGLVWVLAEVWRDRRGRRGTLIAAAAAAGWIAYSAGYPRFFRWYTGDRVREPEYASARRVGDGEFEELARQLTQESLLVRAQDATAGVKDTAEREDRVGLLMRTKSFTDQARLPHVEIFRRAGIRRYDGPDTCLQCHATMLVPGEHGYKTVDTMGDVLDTVHFRLFSGKSGFSTVGYNGERVNSGWYKIPVGKIDRACGIPGSFTWTGWAALVKAKPAGGAEETMSAGCGQCHIGGMYGPPSEAMMPSLSTPKAARDAIDCLICHAQAYDMNEKYVVQDAGGLRWNQDRSLKAAMSVTQPGAAMCLRCHQHNLGGDVYALSRTGPNRGREHTRIIHDTSKRATPFGPDWDVHAAAGMECLDCHENVGHKIARGKLGVDLVANDLPGVEVSCERCHTSAPHLADKKTRAILNGHVARLACETCHITKLHPSNLVLVDWINPRFNPAEGIYTPTAVKVSGELKDAVEYLWLNGDGSFLANALGANPNHSAAYNPLMDQLAGYARDPALTLAGLPERDSFTSQLTPEMMAKRRAMIEANLRPAMNAGTSKIYPFKVFNARMYEDMANQGPFGAMIMPFDYTVYHETGDAMAAMAKAVNHPIVRRMYQPLFKYYMMDRFMAYFGVGSWTMKYPLDEENQKNIEAHWMRQEGTLMINHAIQGKGLGCTACHVKDGLLNYRKLGYSEARAAELENPPELKLYHFDQEDVTPTSAAGTP